MKSLSSLLNLGVLNVNGRTLAENLEGVAIKDSTVIRSLDDPFSPNGGLVVLKGNLSPGGAIAKKSAIPEERRSFRGPARVFEYEEEAIHGMLNQKILPGECVIIRR